MGHVIRYISSSQSESRISCAQLHSAKLEYSAVSRESECEFRKQNKNKGPNFDEL